MLHSAPKDVQTVMHWSSLMQLVINEISSSAPQALQAIKLLAQYQGNKMSKVRSPPAIHWHGRCLNSVTLQCDPPLRPMC
jgi:hypothetical protein